MLHIFGILLELHAIRSCPLSLVGWALGGDFLAPEVARRFDWWERGCLLSPTSDVICLLPVLLPPSTFFNMSRLTVEMSIERIETSVEAYSSDIPVAENVVISWTPDYVLCVRCFNRNINYSRCFCRCTGSSLTSELHMELPFYSLSIAGLWGELVPCQNLWDLWWLSPKILHMAVITLHLWTSNIPMFNSAPSGSVTPRYYWVKVEAIASVTDIESGRISLIHCS